MDFRLSDDHRILKDMIARYLRDQYDLETRHRAAAIEPGFSRERWKAFAELGLIGALLPEEAGGYGGRGIDLLVVMEELGRGLVVEPFLATAVLGAGTIAAAGSDAQKALLEAVIAGDLLLAFAHGEPDSRYALAAVATRAELADGGWRLTGRKSVVINGDSADRLIVSARIAGDTESEDGLALFLVDPGAPGVSRRGVNTVDGGRVAEITLDNVALPADATLGKPGEAYPVIEAVLGRGALALAAESLGAMEIAKDLTLDYLRTRKQFGQPIGKFQALQHRVVEFCLEIEQTRSAVMLAAARLEADRLAREKAIAAAKHLAGRVGRLVAEEAIQMHGGIGMTWEYALPHFAKRLVMIDHQLGDTDHHLERFAALGTEEMSKASA
jgi:alkylation response protein AidB-like acyl-CoA dehydrogenase